MKLEYLKEKKELVPFALLGVSVLLAILILVKVKSFFATSAQAESIVKKAVAQGEADPNILKESITNALFIDDKALEPFEVNKEGFEDFTELYKSFKKYNCLLDIRRYKNIGHKTKFNKSLSKTDLLVLD